LAEIDCKYYWICLSKKFKKEIRNVDKGCITWEYLGDSLLLEFDIEVNFSFGDFIDNKKNRHLQQKQLIVIGS
jgi:hypothetical protein